MRNVYTYLQSGKTIISIIFGNSSNIRMKPYLDSNFLTLLSFSPIDFPEIYLPNKVFFAKEVG